MKREVVMAEKTVVIDYPQRGELITSKEYAIRIEAKEAAKVELSIDGGPWQLCRFAVGYWWFDWSGYLPGKHELAVLTTDENGSTVGEAQRQVRVGSEE